MKKLYLILTLCLLSKMACTQDVFPDSNAIWNVQIVNSEDYPTDEILYGLKGDTLINDTLYNKLYVLSDTALEKNNLKDYLGGIRKENQKIWFKLSHLNSILLYDFSATVGDTIWHNGSLTFSYEENHLFDNGNAYSIVQDISNNGYIYTIIRRDGFTDNWVKGIGSSYGLFGSIVAFPLSGESYHLACFKHNDTVKYKDNLMCNKCFCRNLNGLNKKNNKEFINVFPNPATNTLTVKINNLYSDIRLEIIDETGRSVYHKNYLNNPIYLNNSSKGIYFLKLTIDNEQFVKKIIVK